MYADARDKARKRKEIIIPVGDAQLVDSLQAEVVPSFLGLDHWQQISGLLQAGQ